MVPPSESTTASGWISATLADDQVDELRESLEAARDTARLSPVRRQSLGRLGYYELATDHLDLIFACITGKNEKPPMLGRGLCQQYVSSRLS
jgi:hypothetical protein